MPIYHCYGVGGFVLDKPEVTKWHACLDWDRLRTKLGLPPEPECESDSDSDEEGDIIRPNAAGMMRDLWDECETKRGRPPRFDSFSSVKYVWESESGEPELAFFMELNGPVERGDNPPEPGKEGEQALEWLKEIGYKGRAVWAVTRVTPQLIVRLGEWW